MKHISEIIQDILVEWAYRVHDGMPNPKNAQHIHELRESMEELNLPNKVIYEVIQNLINEEEDDEETVTFKHDGETRTITMKTARQYASDIKQGKGNDEKEAAVKAANLDSDDGSESEKETKPPMKIDANPFDDKEKDTDDKQKKAEKLKKQLEDSNTDVNIRITSKVIKAELEQDAEEDSKTGKEIREMLGSIDTLEGSMKEKALLLTALGRTYGKRDNAGFGKNNFGIVDRDQLNRNKEGLLEGYDDAEPELVENYVRAVRKNKVSEEFVSESFDTLPKGLKKYLSGAGQGGSIVGDKHFLGYKTKDGGITSDINDPNIEKDENGEPIVERGKLPSTARAKLVWRIYLEQGGVCAYTGLPLDLESMDLEHVVGIQNKDKGDPKDHILDRENERNHVLTTSRVNQRKKDMNMNDFFDKEVSPLNDKSEKDFKALETGIEQVNEMQPRTEQTALRMMDEVQFRTKDGKTITQSEYLELPNDEKPELATTDLGTPKVVEANFGPNVTYDTLQSEFDYEEEEFSKTKNTLKEQLPDEDKKKADAVKTKIGKRTLNALGLPGGIQDESGRRTLNIASSDNFYKGFCLSMVEAPKEKQKEYKKEWQKCRKLVTERDENGKLLAGKTYGKNQKNEFTKCVREKGLISDKVLSDERYKKAWTYKNEDGEIV